MSTEAELRRAVIDRLIAASLNDVATTREASLEVWRTLDLKKPIAKLDLPPHQNPL